MNIVQVEHLNDNGFTKKRYTFEVPKEVKLSKGTVVLVENNCCGIPQIAKCVTDSHEVTDEVLDMIMQGEKVRSKVLGEYECHPYCWMEVE